MGNRNSVATIEFINMSDCTKVEITVGNHTKVIHSKGAITKFEITEATPTVIKMYDSSKSSRPIHELKLTLGTTAASQVWKVTNSGVNHKRSPFFTETHTWLQK